MARPKTPKFRNKRGGKKKRARKTKKQQPKIIYVYPSAQKQPQPQPSQQPIVISEQQPHPGALNWNDVLKLIAANVGAVAIEKGVEKGYEEIVD